MGKEEGGGKSSTPETVYFLKNVLFVSTTTQVQYFLNGIVV